MTSKRLYAVKTDFLVQPCLVVEMSLTVLEQPLVVNSNTDTLSQVIKL